MRDAGTAWEAGEGFLWEGCLKWVVGFSVEPRWCLTAPQMPALSISISMNHTCETLWPTQRYR